MKKYRLLKDLPWIDKWEEWVWESFRFTRNYLLEKWFIEEVKEEPKPKFKVWDYVVYESKNIIRYIKIIEIRKEWNDFLYNQTWWWYYFWEECLRLPTQEELEKYFR